MSPLTGSFGNGTRRRKVPLESAKARWYATCRAYRFRRRYFGIEIPEMVVAKHVVIAVGAAARHS